MEKLNQVLLMYQRFIILLNWYLFVSGYYRFRGKLSYISFLRSSRSLRFTHNIAFHFNICKPANICHPVNYLRSSCMIIHLRYRMRLYNLHLLRIISTHPCHPPCRFHSLVCYIMIGILLIKATWIIRNN